MKRSLFVVAFLLAFTTLSFAAEGGKCGWTTTTPTPGATGSEALQKLDATTPPVSCTVLCDETAAGAGRVCGPIYVPGAGTNTVKTVIRVVSGLATGAGTGCGYDNFIVYELSNAATTGEMATIGTLDKDAPTGGTVKQIVSEVPIGPWIYAVGDTTDAGTLTCDPNNHFLVQVLTYNK